MKHIRPLPLILSLPSRAVNFLARAAVQVRTHLARFAPTERRGPEQLDFLSTLNVSTRQDGGGAGTR
jgi:hypothetical protein